MARNIPGCRTVLSPTACGRSPLAEGAKRGGAFYMRPWKFALPQVGTGGYGIRPYVFCRGDHWSPVPVCLMRGRPERTQLRQVGGRPMVAPTFSIGKVDTRFSNGFIFSFALSKTVIYGILFFYKSTGKPGANRRRKAIGAHRVSQLPTSNCCFYCRPQLRVLLGAGVDEGENTAIHRRHKAGHL